MAKSVLDGLPTRLPYYKQRSWVSITLSSMIAFATALWFLQPDIFSRVGTPPPRIRTHNEIRAPRENVWGDLTDKEVWGLQDFLYNGPNDLNLTPSINATGNKIYYTQALRPNKTDVLNYMSGSATGIPQKWAHVVINAGEHPHRTVDEYMVGPLPVDTTTEIIPLSYPYNSGRSSTVNLAPGQEAILAWSMSAIPELLDLLQDLLGDDITFDDPSNLHNIGVHGQAPKLESGRIISWCSLMGSGVVAEAPSLLIQGLYFKLDVSEADYLNWSIMKWMYNGIVYHSTEEFRKATKEAGFVKTPINRDGDWTLTEDFDSDVKERDIPPPVMVQSAPRYGLDRKQQYVSWMGFEFYIAHSQITGITLFDIKFQGEPIIYELGLQEAMAHYAGDDPMQGNQVFLDTFYNMGALMFELVPGYDCPAYASYLDTTWWREGKKAYNKNSICLFEFTADHPIQRHTASEYVSVSRNTYFIVRTVSTVGNYDYTIEYIFYLDGAIEVKIRASGFIFSSYWSTGRSPEYGFRIHDQVASSIHTHVLNFKADVDVGGTQNTLTRVGIEHAEIDYPWDALPPRNTMHLTRQVVTEEAGFNWPANTRETFFIGDNTSLNAWGQEKGYIVRPGTGMGSPVHLVIQNSTAISKAVEWASMDFWVTRQKDTEIKSGSPFNPQDIHNPLIDFSRFIDGENIEQKDLVIYFNLGGHHVPHSGDLPNTLSHTSASSMMFLPHNFHDRDPSRKTSTGVKLDLRNRNNTKYYGGRNKEDLLVKLEDVEPDMDAYSSGEKNVRKLLG
ncbi:hypothetical protein BP6252_02272 [Coleophoma cylindrospora]|uniref:Amine oxidase n=1 Tax=Coleophoma cylindrospora TaxID=1849047 RepID=A0A3D8SEE0_9HELO|nr:hypothetical protein BP6252_02272 [Coleophoma cylindrospora]